MPAMAEQHYHHGDLPTALRSAAVELIAERGPANFSLREVARRAGVSHAAPAHHFGDVRGLLTSVATEGFTVLTSEMVRAREGVTDPREQLAACGKAYVRTALANPGHYGVMIGHDHMNPDDPELLVASVAAYAELLATIQALRDAYNPDLDVDATATLCWSMVHGIVEMASIRDHVAEKTMTATTDHDTLLEQMADLIIDGIRSR